MRIAHTVTILLIVLAIVPPFLSANEFDLTTNTGKGNLNSIQCNIQTTLDFSFSSTSTISNTPAPQTTANLAASTFKFLTASGQDVTLTLSHAILSKSSTLINFVKGYGSRAPIKGATITVEAAFVFTFTDGTNNVYVYIPVVTGDFKSNPDFVDLAQLGEALGSFSLASSPATVSLSVFNILNKNDYNQWYTAVRGTNTVLVSNFVYRIASVAGDTSEPVIDAIFGLTWNAVVATTGDKLCYASTFTTGNFQTHLRESVPLWFIWFWIFFYWLFYLISDSINNKVYDKHFENNKWTCMTLYSLFHLAHQDYFTRLSRSTVIFINWTIQGVFLASIYGNNILGAPMIIWSAVIAFVATIPIPFILGGIFFKKIEEKNLIKYENMKLMKGTTDKTLLEPYEKVVEQCEQKLYGYYHWFYSIAFLVFFICWPIAVNQMQKLARVNYHYHWYWLASMGIVFALQYFIFEPLLTLIFGNTDAVRKRGGQYYNFKLGEAYRSAQTY